MLRSLLILFILSLLWAAVLWFGITPDFSQWSNLRFVAAHVLPPMAPWLAWLFIRHRRHLRKAREAEQRDTHAQTEGQIRLDAARQQHEEELQRRRHACDCRGIAISDLVVNGRFELPEADNVNLKCVPADAVAHADDLLAALRGPVKDALRQIYIACGAAAALPIYIQPPAAVAAAEAIDTVREINRQLIDELALPFRLDANKPPVIFFFTADSAANGVNGLFEKVPDLPGAIILGFDSPLVHAQLGIPATDDGHAGAPSHAAVAMLVTNRHLAEMLGALDDDSLGETDAMTPYWQLGTQLEGNLALLVPVPHGLRAKLANLPLIGRIHRSADGEASNAGMLGLTRHLQSLVERAQINAGLLELPFAFTETSSEAAPATGTEEAPAAACQWLVHNAGQVEYMGDRLVAIGTALSLLGMELKPVDMATNVVSHIGNLGRGRSVAMLAIALARALTHAAPVIWVDFEASSVSVGFVMPVTTS